MATAARYYERLLGLPADVVTPDYFQLLGLTRGSPVDEEQLVDVLAERLDRLESARPHERSIVQHLTRELQRARATLLDPRGHAGHLQEVKQRRLREVPKYVAALLDGKRALSDGAERALLERAPAWDLTPGELTRAIDRALLTLQASRARQPEPLEGAEERVLAVMRKVADEQLRVDAGLTANAEATPRRRRRESLELAARVTRGASGPVEASAGEVEATVEKESTDDEAVHWSPTRPPTPPPTAPATPWAPVEVGRELERTRARRRLRTSLALCVLALAFVAGDLAAAFAPSVAAWLDARTAPALARLWASPDLAGYAAGGAAAALALVGLTVWLAGREARRPFAVPLTLLTVPLLLAGVVPVGHERALLLERDALARDRDDLVRQRSAVATVRDVTRQRETSMLALVTTLTTARAGLEQQLAAREQQLAEREQQLAERAERVTRLERLLRREAETARRLRQETAALQAEVATIRSTTSAGAGAPPPLVTPPIPAVSGARR